MILCVLPKTYSLREPESGYVTGTMTVDNENKIADVHVRSGLYSSDTIFDYSRGYIATRLFSRNACFIMKMNREEIPELEEMGRQAFERQVTTVNPFYSPYNVWVQFQPGNSMFGRARDWLVYGRPIEQLCSGLPLYQLESTTDDNGCASAGIPSILGMKICERMN
uniref:Gastrokine-2 n=1 Tax=Melopsittacus undulatus TaxID=13146 RepID=A0A8C6IU20_MELUD